MKKVLILFLVLLLMTSLFSACEAKSAEPASTEEVFVTETSEESVTETGYKAEIPAGLNYDGAELVIYNLDSHLKFITTSRYTKQNLGK